MKHAPEVADPAARVAYRGLEVNPTHLVLVILRVVLAAVLSFPVVVPTAPTSMATAPTKDVLCSAAAKPTSRPVS